MALFWILAFVLAWLLTLPPALAQLGLIGASPIPAGLGLLIGLAPAIAASVAAAREGRLRQLWRDGIRPGRLPMLLLALLLPPVLLAIAYAVSLARGDPIRIGIGPDLAIFALVWLVLAFGEELGWRGFALPRLAARHGFWAGSMILGLAWCVWHYPRLLGSPYLGSLAEAAPLIGLFSLQILMANFILCWIYFRSGRSVVAATLFHGSFNLVATAYFLAATDLTITAAMALVVGAIALLDRAPAGAPEPARFPE